MSARSRAPRAALAASFHCDGLGPSLLARRRRSLSSLIQRSRSASRPWVSARSALAFAHPAMALGGDTTSGCEITVAPAPAAGGTASSSAAGVGLCPRSNGGERQGEVGAHQDRDVVAAQDRKSVV